MAILWFIIGAVLGLIITSIAVACDWQEHPKREHARRLRQGRRFVCDDCFEASDSPFDYCNPALTISGILITRYNGRAILSRDMQENLQEAAQQLKTRLYSTPIRECISIKEAKAQQQDIYSYAPRSNAAKDYAAFTDEFTEGR